MARSNPAGKEWHLSQYAWLKAHSQSRLHKYQGIPLPKTEKPQDKQDDDDQPDDIDDAVHEIALYVG